jgi:hypothetical protein
MIRWIKSDGFGRIVRPPESFFVLPKKKGPSANLIAGGEALMKISQKNLGFIIGGVFLCAFILIPSAFADEPAIEFTYVPSRCSSELLRGRAINVDPLDFGVAVYIFIPYGPYGAGGWWLKPTCINPLRTISEDGLWTCNITTGGIDETATGITAFLVPKADPVTLPCHVSALPLQLCTYPFAQTSRKMTRTIRFSGYDWEVKSMCDREIFIDPGQNLFSDREDDVWVDEDGRLHLKISQRNNKWYCSEVFTEASLGYGKYIYRLSSRVDQLDQNVVLGLFKWDNISPGNCLNPNPDYREIDIEFSKWGDPADPLNAQYVVQPFTDPENIHRFLIEPVNDDSTHLFHWYRGSVSFQSLENHSELPPTPEDIIESWGYSGDSIPLSGQEKAHINLWLFNSQPPEDGQDVEIIVQSFEFIPHCECDLNHDGSCNILDYQKFIQHWGSMTCGTPPGSGKPPNDCTCDVNQDGKCNILDYQLFIQNWGRTDCPITYDLGLITD